MSFLLPFRSGGNSSKQDSDIEAQKPLQILDTPEQNGHDDSTALQTLEEASFVTPSTPPPLHQSSTLLPYPFAKLVSTTTGLGTLTLRTYARVFQWGMVLGKETTLRSLELTRAGVEGILKASAKDVSNRRINNSELATADTENVLARSINALHWAFTGATFATSAGFTIGEVYLRSFEAAALQSLSTLNAILGETESSRAVSAIITLIKEELTRPGDEDGLVPEYRDLIVGIASFVVLQRWGRRRTELEFRGNGGEETIWDLVIDDKGFRADVVGTKRDGGNEFTATKSLTTVRAGNVGEDEDILQLARGLDLDLPPTVAISAQEQTILSDDEIRDKIVAQLPPGTRAVISSNTMTLKTIRVDIHGSETAHIEAPPGLTMISEHLDGDLGDPDQPHQTIIFRTSLKRSSSADIRSIDGLTMSGLEQDSQENGEVDELGLVMSSPKRRKSLARGDDRHDLDYLNIENSLSKSGGDCRGPVANQKKTRKPVVTTTSVSDGRSGRGIMSGKKDQDDSKVSKASIIKKALQSLSPTSSNSTSPKQSAQNPTLSFTKDDTRQSGTSLPSRNGESLRITTKRVYPAPESVDQMLLTSPDRSPSMRRDNSMSYFTVHEKKRESTFSQTDSISVHSTESRPSSPSSFRTRARADSSLAKTKSHTEISIQPSVRTESDDMSGNKHHYRSRSFVPSLYSMATKHSDEAIILQPKTPIHRSIFEDHKMLAALASDGKVPGMFPDQHLVKSIRRFARFASASYGSNFLRLMGIANADNPISKSAQMAYESIHHEHDSFATHTGLPADTILLSGFCDPKTGPINVSRGQPTMTPLMHFICVDHDSKAIVLTCRGTLGFEDVLTDLTCDYDDFHWQGQTYQVHKGVHASARRLLDGGGQRVMNTIRASLEEFPHYGLVLCGHSLGGAVAAMLALLISEPNRRRRGQPLEPGAEDDAEPSFVTAAPMKLLTNGSTTPSTALVTLPTGRPVHVFAYGPPASFSPALRRATRGLITTIINHNDIVSSLTLGTLHDFKSIAIHLKQDPSSPLVRLRATMLEKIKHAMLGSFWTRESSPPGPMPSSGIPAGESDEEWQWTALTTMRNLMISDKLLPPGEIFIIETNRVFDRLDMDPDSSSVLGATPGDSAYRPLGRSATRVQFKLIRNVESRFREVRFGSGMFGDHSPGRYEGGLGALERGIFEEI